MNTADADIERYFRIFSLLDLAEIGDIIEQHEKSPELRLGQKKLARYVVTTIFGDAAAKQAENISEILFGQVDKMVLIKSMSPEDLDAL
jgi:tyrosyl-tRNA synthetase